MTETDLKEQLVRIDRMREEGLKFSAEQHKLAAEYSKLAAEQLKFNAEAAELARDRELAPWQIACTGMAAGAALFGAGAAFFKLLGT